MSEIKTNNTYIKTYRKCLDNAIFNEKPFDRWHAFEYLVLRAQRFPTDIILKGQTVHLEVGQLIEGEDKLAEKWGWSRGKVRRFIELLVNSKMVSKNGTTLGTVITIENYAFYQCGEPADDTSDGTTGGTSDGTHKKKVKKVKKERIYSENPDLDSAFKRYIAHRKQIKKPMGDDAIKLAMNKLMKLADNDKDRIAIIDESILNGWQGLFALKKEQQKPEEVKPKRYKDFEPVANVEKSQMPEELRNKLGGMFNHE